MSSLTLPSFLASLSFLTMSSMKLSTCTTEHEDD